MHNIAKYKIINSLGFELYIENSNVYYTDENKQKNTQDIFGS